MMTDIPMISVKSSIVESIGHDAGTQTLRVKFRSGARYNYENVSVMEFDKFKNAQSIGSYLNKHISKSYEYEKVG
jgi:hypothetical protein